MFPLMVVSTWSVSRQCPRLGRHLAALPCHPRLGKILVLGWESGRAWEGLLAATGLHPNSIGCNRVYGVGLVHGLWSRYFELCDWSLGNPKISVRENRPKWPTSPLTATLVFVVALLLKNGQNVGAKRKRQRFSRVFTSFAYRVRLLAGCARALWSQELARMTTELHGQRAQVILSRILIHNHEPLRSQSWYHLHPLPSLPRPGPCLSICAAPWPKLAASSEFVHMDSQRSGIKKSYIYIFNRIYREICMYSKKYVYMELAGSYHGLSRPPFLAIVLLLSFVLRCWWAWHLRPCQWEIQWWRRKTPQSVLGGSLQGLLADAKKQPTGSFEGKPPLGSEESAIRSSIGFVRSTVTSWY